MNTKRIFSSVLLIMTLSAGAVYAQDPGAPPPPQQGQQGQPPQGEQPPAPPQDNQGQQPQPGQPPQGEQPPALPQDNQGQQPQPGQPPQDNQGQQPQPGQAPQQNRFAGRFDGAVLGAVGDAVGLEGRDLIQALRESGQTLAEFVAANGGDVDAIREQIAAEIVERNPDATPEEIAERVEQALNELPNNNDDRPNPLRATLEIVSEATGLDPFTLAQTAREQGVSLADLITANGGDLGSVADELIAQFLEQNPNADPEEVAERVNQILNSIPSPQPNQPQNPINVAVVDIVSQSTGLNPRDIVESVREDGLTIAEIIAANGGDVDAVAAELAVSLAQQFPDMTEEEIAEAVNRFLNELPPIPNAPVAED